MASGTSTDSSTVCFPVSDSPQKQGNQGPPVKVPHLPFRRISLPTVPSLLHRVSVVSVASFDPFPPVNGSSSGSQQNARPQAQVRHSGTKLPQSRPVSIVSPRRRNPRRDSSVKPPIDDKLAAKCRKIIDEFYETEKAYVDGLDLIYSHFLTPIITSLDTPEPLLNRSALTSIFSNFIDIWNLHRSFLAALTSLLEHQHTQNDPSSSSTITLPKLSPLLLAHFPYLSLYTPFITAFPSTISALTDLITPPTATRPNPQYNQRFATFLANQESDARCNKLKMRDWLLTIVQRCPRYLLLLKDLINSTNKDDPEHVQLGDVHTLVSKITLSLNTSLQTHAQTLSLLALQKATPNLPPNFHLISPGRTFLKRGVLLQAERNEDPVEREFLLFSDCLVWLVNANGGGESGSGSLGSWDWSWSGSGSGSGGGGGGSTSGVTRSVQSTPVRPSNMSRTRSKSDAEVQVGTMRIASTSDLGSGFVNSNDLGSTSTCRPVTPPNRPSRPAPPPPNMTKRNQNVNPAVSADEKWIYKGRIELIDVQIIVGSALEDERKFEVLSPEGSFVVYAASASDREAWTTDIRQAKSQLLVSLNVTHPNSTLTSSASTNHVRKALQALPYHPSDDRLASLRGSSSMGALESFTTPKGKAKGRFGRKDKDKDKDKNKDKGEKAKEKEKETPISHERRRKVDHWVPAIWIPDGKTSSCMRCGRMFGWRRRRHHCRLCGRCVCAGCSGQTFYITDANTSKPEASTKPARACDACYESVFPLIHPSRPSSSSEDEVNSESEDNVFNPNPSSSSFIAGTDEIGKRRNRNRSGKTNRASGADDPGEDTIASLSRLPSWLSMPAIPVYHHAKQGQKEPHALMDVDVSRDLSLDVDLASGSGLTGNGGEGDVAWDKERRARLRVKSHQKLRSYHEILEDFERAQRGGTKDPENTVDADEEEDEDEDKFDVDGGDNDRSYYNADGPSPLEGVEGEEVLDEEDEDQVDVWFTPTHSLASSPVSSPRKPQRREDTARRSKRFSLPAIALHTTSVTARTTSTDVDGSGSGSGSGTGALSRESSTTSHGHGIEPMARSRRFSLVSAVGAGRRNSFYPALDGSSPTRSRTSRTSTKSDDSLAGGGDLARGLAAARLSELLGRKTSLK